MSDHPTVPTVKLCDLAADIAEALTADALAVVKPAARWKIADVLRPIIAQRESAIRADERGKVEQEQAEQIVFLQGMARERCCQPEICVCAGQPGYRCPICRVKDFLETRTDLSAAQELETLRRDPLCRCPPHECLLHPSLKTCGMRDRLPVKSAELETLRQRVTLSVRDAATEACNRVIERLADAVRALPNRYGDNNTIHRPAALDAIARAHTKLVQRVDSAIINAFRAGPPPTPPGDHT